MGDQGIPGPKGEDGPMVIKPLSCVTAILPLSLYVTTTITKTSVSAATTKRQNHFLDNYLELSYFFGTVTLSETLPLVLIYPTWSVTLQSRAFSYNKSRLCTLLM